jgi:hypothetical protein
MPRYFFVLHGPEDEIFADPTGTELTDKSHAVAHARRIARELKESGGYENPGWVPAVNDDSGQEIATLPFDDTQRLHRGCLGLAASFIHSAHNANVGVWPFATCDRRPLSAQSGRWLALLPARLGRG